MAKLKWDQVGERLYETGTSHGVLFLLNKEGKYEEGVAWNGLQAVRQSPDGADPNDIWADDIKYLTLTSQENFKGTIEAYTYPEEFEECDGSRQVAEGITVGQQVRKPFGLAYITKLGNDIEYDDYSEKLHLIYNAKVSPSERAYETINDTPEAITFSWEFTTTPQTPESLDLRPSAIVTIERKAAGESLWSKLIDLVHGTEEAEPKMPTIDEIVELSKTTI